MNYRKKGKRTEAGVESAVGTSWKKIRKRHWCCWCYVVGCNVGCCCCCGTAAVDDGRDQTLSTRNFGDGGGESCVGGEGCGGRGEEVVERWWRLHRWC